MLYRKFSNPNKITLKELVDKNILNEEELAATVDNMELEGSLYKHLKDPVTFDAGKLVNSVPYSALKKVVCSLFESEGGYDILGSTGIPAIIQRNIVNPDYDNNAALCDKIDDRLFYMGNYDASCILSIENRVGSGEDVIVSKQECTDNFTYTEEVCTTMLMRAHRETAIATSNSSSVRFIVNGPEALVLSFGAYATIVTDAYTEAEDAGTIISTGHGAKVSAMAGVNNFCIRGSDSKFHSFVKESAPLEVVPASLEVTGEESTVHMDAPYGRLKVASDTHVMLGDEVLHLEGGVWYYFDDKTSNYRHLDKL